MRYSACKKILGLLCSALFLCACAPVGKLPAPPAALPGGGIATRVPKPAPGPTLPGPAPVIVEPPEPVVSYAPFPPPSYRPAFDMDTLPPLPLQVYRSQVRQGDYDRFWIASDPADPDAVLFGFTGNLMMGEEPRTKLVWCWPQTGQVEEVGVSPLQNFTEPDRCPIREGWVYRIINEALWRYNLATGEEQLFPMEGESGLDAWGRAVLFLDDTTLVVQRELQFSDPAISAIYTLTLPGGESHRIIEDAMHGSNGFMGTYLHLLLAQEGNFYYLLNRWAGDENSGSHYVCCRNRAGELLWQLPIQWNQAQRPYWPWNGLPGQHVIQNGCYALGDVVLLEQNGRLIPADLGQVEVLGSLRETVVLARQLDYKRWELLLLDTVARRLEILPLRTGAYRFDSLRLAEGGLVAEIYRKGGNEIVFLPASRLLGGEAPAGTS